MAFVLALREMATNELSQLRNNEDVKTIATAILKREKELASNDANFSFGLRTSFPLIFCAHTLRICLHVTYLYSLHMFLHGSSVDVMRGVNARVIFAVCALICYDGSFRCCVVFSSEQDLPPQSTTSDTETAAEAQQRETDTRCTRLLLQWIHLSYSNESLVSTRLQVVIRKGELYLINTNASPSSSASSSASSSCSSSSSACRPRC
jgi:hypothetical protein